MLLNKTFQNFPGISYLLSQGSNFQHLTKPFLLLLPLALQPAVGFGLPNNTSPFLTKLSSKYNRLFH
jgi:hypothetical protein